MKKRVLIQSLLLVFPILAVGLATTADSVMLFDTLSKQTQYFSYFDVLPVEKLAMITPVAGLLAAASGIAAAVYMAKKQDGALKAAGYLAVASACLAVIPNVLRNQMLVIPNVGFPLLMFAEYVLSYYMGKRKQQSQEETKKQNRLPQKRR
ncbi:MAG: hypothetical protein J6V25_03005 [Oscillospiraceae bacterium]|nr:hypothetical protein [Oscillospiraceae bacterium]